MACFLFSCIFILCVPNLLLASRPLTLLSPASRHTSASPAVSSVSRAELAEDLALLVEDVAKSEVDKGRAKGFKSFCDEGDGFWPEWADEFDREQLDTDVWQVINSQDRAEGAQTSVVAGLEVTACRTAHCHPDNVQVKDGKLHLLSERSHEDASKFFTGAVTTKGRKAWADNSAYRMCISAKLPGSPGETGRGIWPAHWMLPENGISDSCLDEGEMDIMEMINSDGGSYSTFHWMSSYPQRKCADFDTFHRSAHALTRMPADWNSEFHEYSVERSHHHLAFAVDGKVVLNVSARDAGTELSHTPFFLILNTAIGGGWPGEPTDLTQLPVDHVIDYVRVARQSASAGAAPHPSVAKPSSLVEVSSILSRRHAWASAGAPPPLSYDSRNMKHRD